MANFNWVNKPVVIFIQVPGTLSTGDGKAKVVAPCNFEIEEIQWGLGNTGGTSGNTDMVLSIGTQDFWTVAAGLGRIAYNATDKYQVIDRSSINSAARSVNEGDVIEVDIDAVPGSASADLWVTIYGMGK